ncbi:MAG: hypothetical protein IKD18_04155 [Clostridia bacterium]|nr:hypothetical protein [Clostridia bacterium]
MKQTRKFLLILLALTMVCTQLLSACGGKAPKKTETLEAVTDTAAQGTEDGSETASPAEKEFLPDRLRAETVAKYPVATDKMSKAELRQLSLDFFLLQLSFQWIPNMEFTDWSTTYGSFKKALHTDAIYEGIPYQSKGFGSVYRWLEYYDEETAIFDVERAFAENGGIGENGAIMDVEKDENGKITYKKYYCMMTMFNQCSSSSFWGWGRVVNSVDYLFTADMTVYNGFIPVGGFTYPNMETLQQFGVVSESNPTGYDTDDVIADWNAANGKDAMYKCYSKMKPADLLVSTGHTLMVKSVDLQYRADGTIHEGLSTVVVQEQIEKWARSTRLDGKAYYIQGEQNNSYSFAQLQKADYIPYTFAEFLDENDPVDKAHLDFYNETIVPLAPVAKEYKIFRFTDAEVDAMSGAGVEETRIFTTLKDGTASVTLEEFKSLAVGSNYPISDCFVAVKDKDGKEVFKNVFRALNPRTREVSMTSQKCSFEKDASGEYLTISAGLEAYTSGEYTVEVSLQLSNGEKPTVFSVTLTA